MEKFEKRLLEKFQGAEQTHQRAVKFYIFSGSKEMSLIADMIISHLNHGYQSSPFLDFAEEQMIHKILGQFYYCI